MDTKHVLLIVGSLRKDSMNKALARGIIASGVEGLSFETADISGIPLYNGDLEADYPASAAALKQRIRAADGVIIVTPEYNRSVPGVLKNAIDWTSRPYGNSAWAKKPVAVAGATEGSVGTSLAQAHLRNILSYLDAHIMGQPEMYIGGWNSRADKEGNITDPKTAEFLKAFAQKFRDHVSLFSSTNPR